MIDKLVPKRGSKDFFGKLLFVFIVITLVGVYILLVSNKVFARMRDFGNIPLYSILVLLLVAFIIMFLILRKKKGVKDSEKLSIKKELPEKKEEPKPEKEETLGVKVEQKNVVHKKIEIEGRKLKIFYSILFLVSVITLIVAYYYNSIIIMTVALVLMLVGIFDYRKIKNRENEGITLGPAKSGGKKLLEKQEAEPGSLGKDGKKRLKEEQKEMKRAEKLRLREERREKKEEEKEKDSMGGVPIVKELSKNLKIEKRNYETDLDILYKIVNEAGRIKLSALAEYFDVGHKKIAEWAAILEEHKLITIHYPPVGEPELRHIVEQIKK